MVATEGSVESLRGRNLAFESGERGDEKTNCLLKSITKIAIVIAYTNSNQRPAIKCQEVRTLKSYRIM